ncbi:MAG: recombinase family protein, partial [Paludibacteraceae bacterium]|nr:recombinase family protein [Paludibacteraceae bacterium]
NLMMIMSILNMCMEKDIQVWTIKDNYRLGNDINSKVLAFAFGLSAEIERNLISQRTREALARKRNEGTILGRPKGSRSLKLKLSGKENKIKAMLQDGYSISNIARRLKVSRSTASSYIQKMGWQ